MSDKYPSGKSYSKGEIRRLAEKHSKKLGVSQRVAEMVVRRTIAKTKLQKFRIPYGTQIGLIYFVSEYKVHLCRVFKRVGPLKICIYRADACNCRAGSNGHRCWHQDAADWALDGWSTMPKAYQRYPASFIKRNKERGKKFRAR